MRQSFAKVVETRTEIGQSFAKVVETRSEIGQSSAKVVATMAGMGQSFADVVAVILGGRIGLKSVGLCPSKASAEASRGSGDRRGVRNPTEC